MNFDRSVSKENERSWVVGLDSIESFVLGSAYRLYAHRQVSADSRWQAGKRVEKMIDLQPAPTRIKVSEDLAISWLAEVRNMVGEYTGSLLVTEEVLYANSLYDGRHVHLRSYVSAEQQVDTARNLMRDTAQMTEELAVAQLYADGLEPEHFRAVP